MRGGPLVVVGDTLLDVDLEGTAGRLAPDAPVPVVDCQRERHRPGGAGLAAVLAAGLAAGLGGTRGGPGVVLITALAAGSRGARLRELLAGRVETVALPLRGGTPCKIRVRASGQPLVRLDAGDGRATAGPLDPAAGRALRSAGAVLVSDYGRGMTAHPGLRAILAGLRATPVIWDPHPRGEPPVRRTRLVTPNQDEARRFAAAIHSGPPDALNGADGPFGRAAADATTLSQAWGAAVAVTLGPRGALLSVGDDAPFLAPAAASGAGRPDGPADACGAGDCFAAAAAQAVRAGALLTEAVTEAVRLASDFVGSGGVAAVPGRTIPPQAAAASLRSSPDENAWELAARVRQAGGRVVATGGCFDLLHAGHVELLRQARKLGDCLIVCLNSDSSVRALKGPGRPLVRAADRARVLAGLECVDGVIVFEEGTPSAVLERLRPDVWVKGGDYSREQLTEAAVVRCHGGEVVLLPYTGRHSTSQIVAAAQAAGAGGQAPGPQAPDAAVAQSPQAG